MSGTNPSYRVLGEEELKELIRDKRYDVLMHGGYSQKQIEELGKKYLTPCTKCGKHEIGGAKFRIVAKSNGIGTRRHPWCNSCINKQGKEIRARKKNAAVVISCLLALLMVAIPAEAKMKDAVAIYTVQTDNGPVSYVQFGQRSSFKQKCKRALGFPKRALKEIVRSLGWQWLYATKKPDYWMHPNGWELPR